MKSISRVPFVLALMVWSCSGGSSPNGASSSSGEPSGDGGSSSSGASGTSGGSSSGGSSSGGSSSGGSSSGGSSSGGSSSGGTDGGDAGNDAAPPVTPPVLSLLGVNQAGRGGGDVLVTITGGDPNKSAFGLDITLADAAGQPVLAFPSFTGGSTAERVVLFDDASAAGLATFTKTVTLPGFYRSFPTIAKVTATVVDKVGASNAMTATLTKQTLMSLGQACDPAIILNRCALGLACDKATSQCVHPAGPALTNFVYQSTAAGGRMLFAGTDPADDLDKIHLDFMDNAGAPVFVDITGNNDLASSIDEAVVGASTSGAFFYSIQSAPPFDQTVLQLGATPSGASGTGAKLTAKLAAPVVAATGAACDLRGFAICGAADSCVTSGAASTCVATAAARTAATTAASILDPQGGGDTFTTGYATATNLWGEPPAGCVSAGVHGMPAGIVVLHLANPTPQITLTADHPETNARVALYAFTGTGAAVGAQALDCTSNLPATLTLTNLQAGDYTVVVGATSATGSHFGLSVQ
jgi:hypothetical protein